jgi:hypothetical protein
MLWQMESPMCFQTIGTHIESGLIWAFPNHLTLVQICLPALLVRSDDFAPVSNYGPLSNLIIYYKQAGAELCQAQVKLC